MTKRQIVSVLKSAGRKMGFVRKGLPVEVALGRRPNQARRLVYRVDDWRAGGDAPPVDAIPLADIPRGDFPREGLVDVIYYQRMPERAGGESRRVGRALAYFSGGAIQWVQED